MAEEKIFEERVKRYFQSIGIYPAGFPRQKMKALPIGWYYKTWGGGYSKAGIPDLVCCIKGVFVTVELKAQKGRPSDIQILNTNRIIESGGCGCFLYPSGYNKFKSDLGKLIENPTYRLNMQYK